MSIRFYIANFIFALICGIVFGWLTTGSIYYIGGLAGASTGTLLCLIIFGIK